MALGKLAFHLLKRPAKPSKRVLGDADASVGDGERDAMVASSSAHSDTAAVRRKLHRIGEQIECDLFERAAVGAQLEFGRYARRQLQLLVLRARRDNPHGFAEQSIETEILEIKPDAPGLDLRHVENIVDDLKQILAAAADIAAVFMIFFGTKGAEHSRFHDFGKADDGIERRA